MRLSGKARRDPPQNDGDFCLVADVIVEMFRIQQKYFYSCGLWSSYQLVVVTLEAAIHTSKKKRVTVLMGRLSHACCQRYGFRAALVERTRYVFSIIIKPSLN